MNFLINIIFGLVIKLLSAWGILYFINAFSVENTTQSIFAVAGILMILEANLNSFVIKVEKGDFK